MIASQGIPAPWLTRVAVSIVCCGIATGCGKPLKLVPASGSVEIGGQPAAGIMVQFLPEAVDGEQRPSSFATTEEDGRFALVTQDGKPGAVEGSHTVILVDTLEERPEQGNPMTRPPRLDSRYATFMGGLKATVTEGGEPIVLEVPKRP
jgi:hypothetical protein